MAAYGVLAPVANTHTSSMSISNMVKNKHDYSTNTNFDYRRQHATTYNSLLLYQQDVVVYSQVHSQYNFWHKNTTKGRQWAIMLTDLLTMVVKDDKQLIYLSCQ